MALIFLFSKMSTPYVLNSRKRLSEKVVQKVRSLAKPTFLAFNFFKAAALQLRAAEMSIDKNYASVKGAEEYQKLCRDLVELRALEKINEWEEDEKVLFFLLAHNTLVCHSMLQFGPPPLALLDAPNKLGYFLGEHFYTLNEMRQVLLSDKKSLISRRDPRVHFALLDLENDSPVTLFQI